VPLPQLRQNGEIQGHRQGRPSYLRTFGDESASPALYAWVLKHGDDVQSGRQWVTEVGFEWDGVGKISCVVSTEETSTLAGQRPVAASRPRLVRYLVKNVARMNDAHFDDEVPGLAVKNAGADKDSYEALAYEISREARNFPIVLISPAKTGHYLIEAEPLQEALVGLAQVVKLVPDRSRATSRVAAAGSSGKELEAAQIAFVPARLKDDHAAQGTGTESIGCMVERHRDSAAIGMAEMPVTSLLTGEPETIMSSAETIWRALRECRREYSIVIR
jgi:hypothetical protein